MKIKKIVEEEIKKEISNLLETGNSTIKPPPANSSYRISNADKLKSIEERPTSSHEEYEPDLSSAMMKTQNAKKKAARLDKKNISEPPAGNY